MNLSVWIRKAFVAQEALYQGTGFSRAEQSDEERGLQPLRTRKGLSG